VSTHEQKVADLLTSIFLSSGRKINAIRVSWIDMNNVDSKSNDLRIRHVEIESRTEVDWLKERA
jgi:hypothetical protein